LAISGATGELGDFGYEGLIFIAPVNNYLIAVFTHLGFLNDISG
jgi:hypothetical protein